jgi:hypothetical protein
MTDSMSSLPSCGPLRAAHEHLQAVLDALRQPVVGNLLQQLGPAAVQIGFEAFHVPGTLAAQEPQQLPEVGGVVVAVGLVRSRVRLVRRGRQQDELGALVVQELPRELRGGILVVGSVPGE